MGFGRGNGSEGVLSSSPIESMVFGQGVSGSSPASPISPAPQMNTVNLEEEWSDNSDEEKKGGRMNWTEEENLKLVSAWLHNSVDAVKGNSQKGQDFWKKIVAEFNINVATDRRRSVSQCKTHYTKTNKIVVHFNGCWIRMKQARGSGESDDQVMEKAHALYKREADQKPFTLVYWWKAVKDQPKWQTEPQSSNEFSSDCDLEKLMFEFMNDPLEAEIEEELEAEIEAGLEEEIAAEMEDDWIGNTNQRQSGSWKYKGRDHEEANMRLEANYFGDNPLYTPAEFRWRYRMKRPLFERIVRSLGEWSPYFRQWYDAFGKIGFSPNLKCTVAMRMLAYGTAADLFDEGFNIGKTTILDSLANFKKGIRQQFGSKYLRRPTEEDTQWLLRVGEARGFPAVASHDLWIWHAFFGVAGSNNDINVLNQSPIFTNILQGNAPPVQFMVNGNQYNMGYYLADGIYPEWATFVKTIPLPYNDRHKLFAERQEAARKDVEWAFGVLQARFAILRGAGRFWDEETLADIMYACIILHNMIVEDERDSYKVQWYNENEPYNVREEDARYDQGASEPLEGFSHGPIQEFSRVLEANDAIHDRGKHHQLKADLVERIWQKFRDGEA
ncbi:hypothetical protein U9M48_027302 [Paspalum notatum var. saurae]|uniref:Myb-like domain-containing protein n=1 Tax=Paspalum notatum var. saurae TaxID=547442 RepID=A0AAQ3WZZ1_PASNO